jgi:hypothetical protein
MKKLILGVFLGAALVLGALGIHVVRDSRGTFVVPKAEWSLDHTYVDSRALGMAEFLKLPGPVQKELASRKAHAVQGQIEESLEGLR